MDALYCPACYDVAGQGEIRANFAVDTGEEIAGSDVGTIPDLSLWHSECGLLGRDSELRVHSEADAAPHCEYAVNKPSYSFSQKHTGDAIHDSDVWLGDSGKDVVHFEPDDANDSYDERRDTD